MTLAYPPFVPLSKWKEVKPLVVTYFKQIKPFRITLKEAGTFAVVSQAEPNVLWLKPDDGGVIAQIRQALESQFPTYVPAMPGGYIPHLSIGFIQGDEALQKALHEVQENLDPIEFTVNEIVYEGLEPLGGGQFFDPISLGDS